LRGGEEANQEHKGCKADVIKLLLVTLGEKGCNYYTKKFHGSVGAFHVKTVDTTGAGDSFVGALLTKIVDDQAILENEARLKEVLRFACACNYYNHQERSNPSFAY
ncbi:protein kinase frk1, partial [Datura stramonium]|nr:protein kinase frk1 [Datura stramonium]